MPSSKADTTQKPVDTQAGTRQSATGTNNGSLDAEDKILTIDRRQPGSDRRKGTSGDLDVGVVRNTRRKKERRRHIDPTTCERDYSDPELEFMRAMDDYKRKSGRMFPTCSEVLEVIRDLGYVKLAQEQMEILGIGAPDVVACDQEADHKGLDQEEHEESAEI